MLNQCRILYFTINIRRNSVHVIGCIGVEELPKKTSQTSSLKSPLQWIWNDDSDFFTNFKGFPVTGYVNQCPIHYFKS
jgi:hypothetical protein